MLTAAEVGAIVAQCSPVSPTGVRDRALLVLLWRSGLRISEALALKPADVDPARRTIRVLDGKGGTDTTRGWHPAADDALGRWLDLRARLGLGGPLFCTLEAGRAGPIWPQQVRALIRRLAAGAQIGKRVHPHGLRHTFAVDCLVSGLDVVTISKLLGHRSVATTVRYLDHLDPAAAITALAGAELPEG